MKSRKITRGVGNLEEKYEQMYKWGGIEWPQYRERELGHLRGKRRREVRKA